jgi:outer membrane protein OmpA-like peptidoglycan-associated protein
MLNNTPIANTNIYVREGSVITRTVSTKNKTEFIVPLDYGKKYQIYFQNPRCPVMYLEVVADNVPEEKQAYRMQYELNIPFVDKNDEDIDTTVFAQPFHRVIYNGKTRMIDDSAYNNQFARNVLKKVEKKEKEKEKLKEVQAPPPATITPEALTHFAGKIILGAGKQLPVGNKYISLINKNGQVISTTGTNRYGSFIFANIKPSEVALLRMEVDEAEMAGNALYLLNSKNQQVANSSAAGVKCEWPLGAEQVTSMLDENYTSNIGGKLISSSPKEKKFFANKTVYLANKLNTVLMKTRTNLLGTFVFEDIRPDHSYFVGVDRVDIAPGEKIDLLSKEDNYVATLDSVASGRNSVRINSNYNKRFSEVTIGDNEMKMDVKATIFGDNVNTPIGKLKIILLNDNYEVIDSAITDNFGTFKFKYLPFLKRFYLSAENTDNILDVFKNILIYSSDDNLIKIMTHQKGTKFNYKPVNAEISRLRDIELDDPWLQLIDEKETEKPGNPGEINAPKSIVENILFETNKYDITPQAKEILDKIILVLNTNKQLRIEIGAHTDSKGSNAANMKLSGLRASTVQSYIVKTGIAPERIVSKGYGETKLLNNCGDGRPCSEFEHAQNRRIEFKILEKGK